MFHELFKYAMFFGILLGIVFLVFTNFSKNRKDKSIVYLNLFVLFFTLNNLQITLVEYGFINLNFFERKFLIPWYVLIIPSFYAFVGHYLKIQETFKSYVLISAVLFLTELGIRLLLFPFYYNDHNSYLVAKYVQIEEIINIIFTLYLYFRVVLLFFKQTKHIAYISSFDNLKWIRHLLFFGFLIMLLWVMAVVFNLNKVIDPEISLYYPLRFFSSLIIIWIAYFGFFRYNLLTERIQLRELIFQNKLILDPKSKLDADFEKVYNYIVVDKRYLDHLLSTEEVAKNTHIGIRNISKIVLAQTEMNFSDYINHLRIAEAKIILLNPDYQKYTINAIGLECGFYSKATFYRAFSKHAHTNPVAFRKENT